jgi:hypothetical protein
VAGVLTLTSGMVSVINTGSLDMLTGSSNSLGSSSSFIDGSFSVSIASTSDEVVNFPIGKDGSYKPVSLTVRHSTAAPVVYTAEMINTSARDLSYIVPGSLNKVSDFRYYSFNRSGSAGLVTASITIYYDSDDGVTDESYLRVASYDGSGSWVDEGGSGTSSPSGSITISGISSLRTTYTLGNAIGGSNPLPVNWLSFDAKRVANNVNLTWATSSESGADYYLIERSNDGFNFESLGKVKAIGNSTVINKYHYTDAYYLPNVMYYRLKQVDVNGKYCYTSIRTVYPDSKNTVTSFYPNPVSGNTMHVYLGNKAPNTVNVVMYSETGKICSQSTYYNCTDVLNIHIPDTMKSGVYKFVCYDMNDNKIADSGVIVE